MMQNGDAISDQKVHVVAVSDDNNIQALIKTIRGVQVILDRDVAGLYGVATGALNRQVKRNEERFPEDFMFKLSAEEWNNLKCQIGISSWGGDRQLPYAFTENGIAMLSSVLRSPTAIEVNIRIMRAFSAMRRFLLANAQMFQRIETVEKRQIATDAKVDSILERLDATEAPVQGVFTMGSCGTRTRFVVSGRRHSRWGTAANIGRERVVTSKQSFRGSIFSTNMMDSTRPCLMPVFSTCSDRFPDEALFKGVDLVNG